MNGVWLEWLGYLLVWLGSLYCREGPSVAVDGRLGQDRQEAFGSYGVYGERA